MVELLHDMALFVEVARTGSFTRAAAHLGLPVSSLSRRVARLERNIGAKLLLRTTRRVDLTEAGLAYLQRCGGLVDEARVAHEDLQALVSIPSGRLRVSLTSDFATLLAPLLIDFHRRYPEIAVDLDLTSRRADLLTDPIDVSLRIGALADSTLVARRLASFDIGLFASPDYLARHGRPRSPRDLASHRCLRMPGHLGRAWTMTKDARSESVNVDGPFSANGMAILQQLAMAGLGIVALDALLARTGVAAGTLEAVLPRWRFDPVPAHALLPSRLVPAKTRVFVDFLVETLQALAPSVPRRGRASTAAARPRLTADGRAG